MKLRLKKIHIIKVSDTLSGTKNELDLIFEFVDYLESGLVKVNPNNQIYLKDWSNNSFHQKLVNYSYTPNSGFLGTIPDALKSDGIDDWRFEHVQDGLVSVDASFSYCAMFKPSSNKIVRLVRGNSDSINGTICFLISLGNDYSYIRVNDVIREKPLELSTDIFTSIIITCSLENDLIVYINGTLLDIHGAPNTLPAMPYVQHSMSGETYTSESIAMEAFFNKALSQIEVENLHTILAQRFNE